MRNFYAETISAHLKFDEQQMVFLVLVDCNINRNKNDRSVFRHFISTKYLAVLLENLTIS
jgi:hypothetical protein